jgi:ribonucleoside-triphosphate reductase
MGCRTRVIGNSYTLIATPAEGLSDRFLKLDRKRYGKIEGVTNKDFYTNSFHIPVNFPIKAFKKIELEAPYHTLTNAGHISYVELDGDPLKNLKAFEKIVKFMKEQGVGYGSINHPVDRDPICGYTGIIDGVCPKCGRSEEQHRIETIQKINGFTMGCGNKKG